VKAEHKKLVEDIAAALLQGRTWATIDKSSWGPGEWQCEPDKVQWIEHNLDCLMTRGPHGGWCGYVGVPEDHPAFGKGYDEDELAGIGVHGGLTYAGESYGLPESDICHVPAPGRPEVLWWLGFDCAHAGDISPAYHHTYGLNGVYRNRAYVKDEVTQLAKQLAALT
jgi:hypothetical protein